MQTTAHAALTNWNQVCTIMNGAVTGVKQRYQQHFATAITLLLPAISKLGTAYYAWVGSQQSQYEPETQMAVEL